MLRLPSDLRSRHSRARGPAVAVIVALALLGGCTQGRSTPDEYNADLEEDFVESCIENGGGDPQVCGCAYEAFEQEVPIEEFQGLTEDLEDEPAPLPEEFVAVYDYCVGG